MSGLQSSIDTAEEKLADAKEQIAEYQSYVNDGSYKSYFKVDEYEALYEENLKVLTDKMDEWGVPWEQVTGGYFYASGSGTVLRTMARAEQQLNSGSILFLYSNPDEMSVTVSVDQTDIAKRILLYKFTPPGRC